MGLESLSGKMEVFIVDSGKMGKCTGKEKLARLKGRLLKVGGIEGIICRMEVEGLW